ncbi:23S rRNA (adenine(2503)-C(2))-methyltransferase RlmN [Athalassotoga saccharophila]|uniref:23S rRNA (adenine(2503)-C(2))-methyltransferase RlmN n=1 Tax=Athalassotoga saccharophila TaxID=1441386 RepID=UPI0013796211|nr:23S rRNA (adenine(2503)-C(2))-methyltransferase RlmN [Athalassotoga saccharophila]BBJ28866.1 23S rRNA (adenine(2503)-C(2))-methyltransferase [Athalassotoga saccharophila]
MENILDYDFNGLKSKLESEGLESYRAIQIFDWIYQKHIISFAAMTNISKQLRESLSLKFSIDLPELVKKSKSLDGTVKFLWKYKDGNTVESVILRYPDRISGCISSQVGCPLNCAFCATGMSGYIRNLTSGEIIGQILGMEIEENEKINNIVFMGMGEPMLNYDEVMRAIRVITDPKAFKISQRRVSVSTAGIVDGIIKMANEPLDLVLSISLHAPTDEKRSSIMPINKKYNLKSLIESVKTYQRIKNRRVTFEYILFDHFNDTIEDAKNLVKLLEDIKCNVNLIRYNDTGSGFLKSTDQRASEFEKFLKENGIEAVIRAEKGADIDAACGQLRRRTL